METLDKGLDAIERVLAKHAEDGEQTGKKWVYLDITASALC